MMTSRYEQNRQIEEAYGRLRIQAQTVANASESAYATANRAAIDASPENIADAKAQAERLVASLTYLATHEARVTALTQEPIP